MAISFIDSKLEQRLTRLGQMQSVPVSKHAIAKAILEEATKDLRRPHGWRKQAEKLRRPPSAA